MKPTRLALALSLCLFPALAVAQRGGGGGVKSQPRPAAEPATAPRPHLASRGDIEDLSPAAYLRDKRKKLQLDDATVKALATVEMTAKKRNEPMLVMYDSVRREVLRFAGAPALGENANVAVLRQMALSNLLTQIHESRQVDRAEALAAIPSDKKEQADALLKGQDEEFDRTVGGAPGRGRL